MDWKCQGWEEALEVKSGSRNPVTSPPTQCPALSGSEDIKAALPLPSEGLGLSGFTLNCKTEARLLCLKHWHRDPSDKALIDGLAPPAGIIYLAATEGCLHLELGHYMSQSLGKVKKARFNSWLELPTLTSSSPGGSLSAQGSVRGFKLTLKRLQISLQKHSLGVQWERESRKGKPERN